MLKRIDFQSNEYPPKLRQIHKPPESLFVKGELPSPNAPMVAVVGSRMATPYGRRSARLLTETLARSGIVIVSGLAYGIDAIAHEAALDVGGKTIAVLASNVNDITPVQHRPLAERILDHGGAIVSEIDGNDEKIHLSRFSFPVRNRIISGLCLATLVVEATTKSGSLITAKFALEQGREVFAVPGPIDSETSGGTNALIKSGAHVCTSANDILDVLGMSGVPLDRPKTTIQADSKEEATLLPLLSKKPRHLDEIIRESRLPASVVSTTFTLMEIKGKTRHVGGNQYIIG